MELIALGFVIWGLIAIALKAIKALRNTRPEKLQDVADSREDGIHGDLHNH